MTIPTADPVPPSDAVRSVVASTGLVNWKLIVGFGAWSVFVWATRIRNIWSDLLLTTDERVWLSVMALTFVVLGIATVVIGLGLRRWPPTRGDLIAVGLLGGWTLGVWITRTIDIVGGGDHGAAFVAVHVVLAIVSVALAALSWRELSRFRGEPETSSAAPPLGSSSGEGPQ